MAKWGEQRKSERIFMETDVTVYLIKNISVDEINEFDLSITDLTDPAGIEKMLKAKLLNISPGAILINKEQDEFGSGGVLLESGDQIEENQVVLLSFTLAFTRLHEQFHVLACCIRSNLKDEHYETGFEFIKVLKHSIATAGYEQLDLLLNL